MNLDVYRQRAGLAYYAYVRRDPMEQLRTRLGRNNPYQIYERIRRAGPVVPGRLIEWMSVDWHVCSEVLRDRRFGSQPPDSTVPSEDYDFSFLELNEPDHTRLRRVVAPLFAPREVARMQDLVDTTTQTLLDSIRGTTCDVMRDIATPLPTAVVCDLLGVPARDRARVERLGNAVANSTDSVRTARQGRDLDRARAELRALFSSIIDARRSSPSDDLISRLVAAEGEDVRTADLVPLCQLLLIAATESVAAMIGNALIALFADRGQWDDLGHDPSRSAAVTQEVLRFDPPIQRATRFALEDVDVGGRHIARGDRFMCLIGGANRDPDKFDRPEVFDTSRGDGADHLAFSAGIHFCLGHLLARMQGETALAALASRWPGLRPAGRVTRRTSTSIRGPAQFPVALQP